jgi:hypothetical protein
MNSIEEFTKNITCPAYCGDEIIIDEEAAAMYYYRLQQEFYSSINSFPNCKNSPPVISITGFNNQQKTKQ